MAEENEPQLDEATLAQIEADVAAQFNTQQPELDAATLAQIEADVAAQFSGSVPATDITQMPTQMQVDTPQAPQINPQQQAYEQQLAAQQAQQDQIAQQQAYEQQLAQQQAYEQQAQQPQQEYYEEPAPVPTPGKKKKKLKGGKTKVNLGTSRSPAASGRRKASGKSGRRATQTNMEDTVADEEVEAPANKRRTGRRTGRKEAPEKKSKKGLFIGIGVGAVILIIILVVAFSGGDKATPAPAETASETTPAVEKEKPKAPKKEEEPAKPTKVATGAYSEEQFRILVLKFINNDKFERAELYINSRNGDAPNEDLSFLKKKLKKAKERAAK